MQIDRSVGEIMTADHVELDDLLSQLLGQIISDSPDLVSAYKRLDLFWARLAVHIRAEHLVIFPALIEAARGHEDIAPVLQELRRDHDFFIKELARAVKAMRLVPDFGNEAETFDVVRSLLDGVDCRMARHNQIEEDIIYPLAGEVDTEHLRARTMNESVLRELRNLPQRFRTT